MLVRSMAVACPKPVRAKMKKTDYPLPGGMALIILSLEVDKIGDRGP